MQGGEVRHSQTQPTTCACVVVHLPQVLLTLESY